MNAEKKRIIAISDLLTEASSSVRILRNVAWPKEIKEDFFRSKEQTLPSVSYAKYNPKEVLNYIKKARKIIGGESNEINTWASDIANKIESSALLLSARGTSDFFKHSEDLYGKPTDPLQGGTHTTLDLAQHFEKMFHNIKDIDLGLPSRTSFPSKKLATKMEQIVKKSFGPMAPEIALDESLASNVLAGRRRVSIRPAARFTDKDLDQLIQHELFVHVATSLNGYHQSHLKILREAHPGTTKTQEGLAVFAEFITASIDLDRVRRLSDRVITVQMAIDGANFMEVYQYYIEITDNKDQSFESAKRVFRGGLITGKAPFTKDIVYLEGLISIHNFLRVAITSKKLDYLDLLFVGKLNLSDLPVLKTLFDMGLVDKPQFVPPWIKDKRYLLSFLSYSSFVEGIDIEPLKTHYESLLR